MKNHQLSLLFLIAVCMWNILLSANHFSEFIFYIKKRDVWCRPSSKNEFSTGFQKHLKCYLQKISTMFEVIIFWKFPSDAFWTHVTPFDFKSISKLVVSYFLFICTSTNQLLVFTAAPIFDKKLHVGMCGWM